MFKRILVPLGDSRHTPQAFYNACQLAGEFDSQVTCLHIIDEEKLSVGFSRQSQMPDILEAVQKELRIEERFASDLFERMKKEFPGVEMACQSVTGTLAGSVLGREMEYDLIVTGKAVFDEGDILDISPGVREILHRSILPVLLSTDGHPLGVNLMACYDGSKSAFKALGLAVEVAKKFGTTLNILTVLEPFLLAEEYRKKALEINQEAVTYALTEGFTNVHSIIEDLNTIGTILGEIEHLNINFLFMGAYGGSPLKALALGSTTDEIITSTGCPIIMYR